MNRNDISMAMGAAFCLALFSGCEKETRKEIPPPQVGVYTAAQGKITEMVRTVGEPKSYNSVDLVARVEGYLIKRNFTEGEFVKKGQLLYQIEPEIYTANVKAAEGNLEKAKAALANAELEMKRQATLIRQDATSERAYEKASTEKLEADAGVKISEAALAIAKQDLGYTQISAPFDGWVGLSARSEGNLVNLASGALTTLQQSDPMRVELTLNEMDLLTIQEHKERAPEGIKVHLFFQDGTRYEKEGKISFWDNRLNPSTGTLKLQALFENPKRDLLPGMFVRVLLEPPTRNEALLIPLEALMNDQAGDYVYILAPDGVVSRRTIKTGYRDEEFVVVEDKLKAGEKVIVTGVQKVRPGAKAVGTAYVPLKKKDNQKKSVKPAQAKEPEPKPAQPKEPEPKPAQAKEPEPTPPKAPGTGAAGK